MFEVQCSTLPQKRCAEGTVNFRKMSHDFQTVLLLVQYPYKICFPGKWTPKPLMMGC